MAIAPQLAHAQALLELVESALKQVTGGREDRHVPGVRNVLVFGGLFMTAMKAIARRDALFASWFDLQQPPERVDELRRQMLREEKPRRGYTQVQLASAGKEFGPRPANARAFFTGDRLGGAGWEIDLPDARVEKYYVLLPEDSFSDVEAYTTTLMRSYVAFLHDVMRHAKIALR